jgi:hypothetical protein
VTVIAIIAIRKRRQKDAEMKDRWDKEDESSCEITSDSLHKDSCRTGRKLMSRSFAEEYGLRSCEANSIIGRQTLRR